MILLNGIILNPSMQWTERFASHGVAQVARPTLGGRNVINAAPLSGGRNITLTATEDTGWLSHDMVRALLAAAQIPGNLMYLTFHDELDSVLVTFRHHDAPALDINPLNPKAIPDAETVFIGSIKLVTI